MKNMLVPVDYSDAAKNALHYALGLAKQIEADKIILYNAFQPPVPADSISITTDGNFNTLGLYDMESLTESNKVHLERLKQEITESYGSDIAVETISEFNLLSEGVAEICRSQNIALIVMGISEADGLSEALVGSNSLDVAKHVITPVIIVPRNAAYRPIQQILFTCDYKNVAESVPVASLKNILGATNAHLHVLHVDANAETQEHLQQAAILKNLLHDVAADYHTIQHDNFKETVDLFAAQHNIDLIIAIPKKYGFFQSLFHHSYTKLLAFHSHIPLLLIHEES
ncbi:universal stress protein [Ilyomonas limi]|uniref:Universal stress protein n=1 Tax=Ilyomonas limi TaxID=2575867 RepID=A0A4U3L384_9BACT|nr:universal stress protein [Ilyomonas limi]TKK69380.1 universal stress protein [Ilyomonas limi]